MPTVEYAPLEDTIFAPRKKGTLKRKLIAVEYDNYVYQLVPGMAGKIELNGEKSLTVRNRLASASKRMEKPLTIRRKGDTLYFRLADEG